MTDSRYFEGVKNQKCFNRQQVLQSFRNAGYKLSDSPFYKIFASMIKGGDLARVGNGLYCLPDNNARPYDHEYSDLAVEVASLMQEKWTSLRYMRKVNPEAYAYVIKTDRLLAELQG